MTREQWARYIKRLDNCGDCDSCPKKKACIKRFDKKAERCKFGGIKVEDFTQAYGMTPGNPCVEGVRLRCVRVKPLAIEHVKGEPLFGDGGHRKWRFGV